MSIIIKNIEYVAIKELGKGGNGRVIKVLNKLDNKYYAIKEIEIKEDIKNKIKNFENEAIILSKFNCKNIVKYYDSFKDNDKLYILMEFCDGLNLRDYIDKNIKNNELIEENILYDIIKQICMGIKEIHNKDIIHRDLKPENIFMNDNMDIKIGDFGISKYFGENKEYTKTINKAGSIYYIAPEIMRNGVYNKKSDMYSLGCIIYELFHLSMYYFDKDDETIKKIDKDLFNYKWQEIINSLLQKDYNKRMDINKVYNILINEIKINMNINNEILSNSLKNKNNNKNIIIGEIYISLDNINKDILIINSFENVKREYNFKNTEDDFKYENEKEIKENIEIRINGKIIEFTYHYKFKNDGKYIIEYIFKNNLTKTDYMFCLCESLTNLDLSNFNTQDVTNMTNMFANCNSLTNLNLSNFNTQNVTDMSYIFYGCRLLKNLDLSNFNTQNLINMRDMFSSCESLINLNLSNFNTQNVKNMSSMFLCCTSLINLDLSNFNTKNVTNMSFMFSSCFSLSNLNISNFNTQNVTDMKGICKYCESLTNLDLSNFNTQNVRNMSFMFNDCKSFTNLNLSNFNTENVTNMSYMFLGCESLTNLNLINFNTQNVVYMDNMFYGCKSLKDLNLSNFNTQNVTDMREMFAFCESLTDLNLSNFNTKKVKVMSDMFRDCKSLTNLNLSNFNIQNDTAINWMFHCCNSLTKDGIITHDDKILNEF